MGKNVRWWAAGFMLPGLALYIYIVIMPAVTVVNDSFYNWSAGQTPVAIGLGNYREMIHDSVFISSVWHTVALLIGALIIQIPLGFFFAVLIYKKYRGSSFFQAVYFIPVILSTVVIGVLWTQVYQAQYGLLNTVLRAVGLGGLQHAWLGETGTTLYAVIVVVGWQYVGLYMLIFLAAMQAIPPSLFEAGELDGAVGWRQTTRITIPLMLDTVKLSVILVVTGAVQYFNLIWAMTKGGPANSSSVLASYMYTEAFTNNRLGYGAAIATVMLVVNLVLAIGLQRVFRRDPLEVG